MSFRVAAPGSRASSWDRALFLNLTFWNPSEPSDILVDKFIDPDVVAHVAWHHLARRALAQPAGIPPGSTALFLGESVASAFDLYLVGRLIGRSPDASFLRTVVPAMADAAESAGLPAEGFEAMLHAVADDPDRAFEDLRELLFDVTTGLVRCSSDEAPERLSAFDGHRFASLLHYYEISNWILHARAYASSTSESVDSRASTIDAALRSAPVALDWLEKHWLADG